MNVPVKQMEPYDVIVVGGGIAGVSAAVSAARLGKNVLLIEKSMNLGGLATRGLISWYEPLCDGTGTQRAGGLAEELLKLATENGFDNLPPDWDGHSNNAPHNDRYSTYFSPTFFSLSLDKFVEENGAHLLFDTLATYPVMDKNLCRGIITENTDGRCFYPTKIIIDATGDASVFARAGARTQEADNFITYIVHETDYKNTKDYIKTHDLSKLRRWKSCGSDYLGNGQPLNMPLFRGTTSKDINFYIKYGKRCMLEAYSRSDKNEREILSIPEMPQIRVIRRIIGDYTFTGKEENYIFPDSVGCTGDFRRRGVFYSIPSRCLFSSQYPNLLAAGRIVSAVGDGMEILRVIPCCALTGQAAGIIAGLSVEYNAAVNKVPYSSLYEHLKSGKAII